MKVYSLISSAKRYAPDLYGGFLLPPEKQNRLAEKQVKSAEKQVRVAGKKVKADKKQVRGR